MRSYYEEALFLDLLHALQVRVSSSEFRGEVSVKGEDIARSITIISLSGLALQPAQ